MDRKIIYTKFSKTRKKEVSLETSIFQDEKGELRVEKKGNKYSKDTIEGLLNAYKRIQDISKDFAVIPIKQNNEYSVEFPFIQGRSLHELASVANSKEEFNSVISHYIKLLDSIPTIKTTLTKEFEDIFGEVDKEKEYLCLKEGILDLNLGNLILDSKGKIHFIDYEWVYNFPIPKEYILFRALSVLCINTTFKTFYTTEELLNQYILNKDTINQYNSWEKHFQKQIVSNQKNYKRYLEPNINIDILEMDKANKSLEEEVSRIRIEHKEQKELLKEQKKEIEEFRSFKKSKIWKSLTIWRKFKKYFKNFFINIREDGFLKTFRRMFRKIYRYLSKNKLSEYNKAYQRTLKKSKITKREKKEIQLKINLLKKKPLISIVMPVYNVEPKWLHRAIKSIRKQIYTHWELCIADDKSTDPRIKPILINYMKADSRIKVVFRKINGHISESTNSALEISTGEYIALMDNDDVIYPKALYEIAKAINNHPDVGVLYSDEDKMELNDKRVDPIIKPPYSPDYLLSTNYFCHLSIIKKSILDKIGGFRKGYEGSQDYDVLLRAVEQTEKVLHIPEVLYGWRKIPGSTALNYDEKGYAQKTSLIALKDTIKRRKISGEVENGLQAGFFRIRYNIDTNVSITILVNDKKSKEEEIRKKIKETTKYKNLEVFCCHNFQEISKKITSKYIILLDKDALPMNEEWIETLLEYAQRDDIVAVSGKIMDKEKQILCTGFERRNSKIINTHVNQPAHMQTRANLSMHYKILPLICIMVQTKNLFNLKILEDRDYKISFVSTSNQEGLLYTPYSKYMYSKGLKR